MKLITNLLALFAFVFALSLHAQTTVSVSNVLTMIQCGNPTISTSTVQAFFTPTTTVTSGTINATTTTTTIPISWAVLDTSCSVSTTDVLGNTVWINGAGAAQATLEIALVKLAAQTSSSLSSTVAPHK